MPLLVTADINPILSGKRAQINSDRKPHPPTKKALSEILLLIFKADHVRWAVYCSDFHYMSLIRLTFNPFFNVLTLVITRNLIILQIFYSRYNSLWIVYHNWSLIYLFQKKMYFWHLFLFTFCNCYTCELNIKRSNFSKAAWSNNSEVWILFTYLSG